jgi:hypothetical protein
MFIEDLHNFLNLLKNQGQARYYNREDIELALNRSQLDLFREYYKLFEDTQEISDSLIPFKEDFTYNTPSDIQSLPDDYAHLTHASAVINGQEYPAKITSDEHWNVRELNNLQHAFGDNIEPFKHSQEIVLTDGVGQLPDDYVAYIEADGWIPGIPEGAYEAEVDITNEHQFVRRKNDKTYPPIAEHPYGWIGSNQITIVPDDTEKLMLYYYRFPSPTRPLVKLSGKNIQLKPVGDIDELKIDYLRVPVNAEYAYTIINSRDIVFDEGNSTDVEWFPLDHSALVLKTLQYLGVPLKDQLLVQFEQAKQDVKPEITR